LKKGLDDIEIRESENRLILPTRESVQERLDPAARFLGEAANYSSILSSAAEKAAVELLWALPRKTPKIRIAFDEEE